MIPIFPGELIIRFAAPARHRDEISGDLRERYYARVARDGRVAATRAFYADVVASLPSLVALRARTIALGEPVRSLLIGCAGCLALLGTWLVGDRLGLESFALSYAIVAVVTAAVSWGPRGPRIAAVATLFVTVAASIAVLAALTPGDAAELRDPWFFARLGRLAGVMAGILIATNVIRRRLRRA